MNYLKIYSQFLNKYLKVARPLKIVCDASNGSAGPVLKETFKNHQKIKLILINQKPNGNFPAHGPNPLVQGAMEEAAKRVLKEKADLGAVFDADADRIFFIDDKGQMLPSYLTSIVLFKASRPPFVADELVYQSLRLLKIFSRKDLLPSKVGSYYLKTAMQKYKANVSAEYSGHFYFKDFFYADSGMLALIKMCNFISQNGLLSEFLKSLPVFSIQAIEIKNADFKIYEREAKKIATIKKTKIERRDGISLVFKDGFLNLRASNTEPLIRLTAGARNKADCLDLLNLVKLNS